MTLYILNSFFSYCNNTHLILPAQLYVLYCIVLYCILRPDTEGRLDRYRIGIHRELSEICTQT